MLVGVIGGFALVGELLSRICVRRGDWGGGVCLCWERGIWKGGEDLYSEGTFER